MFTQCKNIFRILTFGFMPSMYTFFGASKGQMEYLRIAIKIKATEW